MKIYIVFDYDDRSILGVYDEETFKKEYKQFLSVCYQGQYWDKYIDVYAWEINTDNRDSVSPQTIEALL
jgi:hypothetical protein